MNSALAAQAGVPADVLSAIQKIESSGRANAVRFETRLFRERTGQTIEGSSRAVFEQAFRINARAAVESSSFGLYQVLGGALIRLYGSPEAGLRAFDANPARVSDQLLVAWFQSRPQAQEAAREGNWTELARLYNGSSTTPWLGRFQRALAEVRGGAGGIHPALGFALGFGAIAGAAALIWLVTRERGAST